jgi:hypothetical protein
VASPDVTGVPCPAGGTEEAQRLADHRPDGPDGHSVLNMRPGDTEKVRVRPPKSNLFAYGAKPTLMPFVGVLSKTIPAYSDACLSALHKAKSGSSGRCRTVLNAHQACEIFGLKDGHGLSSLHAASIQLAIRYGVSGKAIRDIWKGRSWLRTTYELWDPHNRPEQRMIGRPKGKKDSGPRKYRDSSIDYWNILDVESKSISPQIDQNMSESLAVAVEKEIIASPSSGAKNRSVRQKNNQEHPSMQRNDSISSNIHLDYSSDLNLSFAEAPRPRNPSFTAQQYQRVTTLTPSPPPPLLLPPIAQLRQLFAPVASPATARPVPPPIRTLGPAMGPGPALPGLRLLPQPFAHWAPVPAHPFESYPSAAGPLQRISAPYGSDSGMVKLPALMWAGAAGVPDYRAADDLPR